MTLIYLFKIVVWILFFDFNQTVHFYIGLLDAKSKERVHEYT